VKEEGTKETPSQETMKNKEQQTPRSVKEEEEGPTETVEQKTEEGVEEEAIMGEAVIQIHDGGVHVLGANIPQQIVTQIVATAVLTTITVSVSTEIGKHINAWVSKMRRRMSSENVRTENNPLSKIRESFTDTRPKVIIRRAHRGGKIIASMERFNPDGENFFLPHVDIGEGERVKGLLEIMKAQDPHFSKNLDIRIDSSLKPYFAEEEISIWENYFTKHEKLFSGVR
jgi:hypothetical protein